MLTIIGILIVGLIAGALARLLVPGRDPMGFLGTLALGVVGSFLGGTLWVLLFEGEFDLTRATTIIGAIIGAIIALLIWRAVTR
ncbi:MAG: GlsB/YeaQ/YmgE family stress response membrane protein [Actinomycetota bacterium]|nr:GlsB/YeaQ/YmgE family stress response membrane protein [Actinomycetota bacterium]